MEYVKWKCNNCKKHFFISLECSRTYEVGYKCKMNWCKECGKRTETEVTEITPW